VACDESHPDNTRGDTTVTIDALTLDIPGLASQNDGTGTVTLLLPDLLRTRRDNVVRLDDQRPTVSEQSRPSPRLEHVTALSDQIRYENLISPDALALVRFGLRDANDPRILNTVRVIDALLCRRTKTGPTWYRYNNDGYGEHEDGSPFDGVGVGRGWPLLAGERAHYELARGRPEAAVHLLGVMRAQTSDGGMLPEQVWDGDDLPERELLNGRPSGSAMPLVWAHAEYVKLVRSLRDGVVFDMPDQPYERYVRQKITARHAIWSAANKTRVMRAGRTLRVQTTRAAMVHWSRDGWSTWHDTTARAAGTLGVWIADLDTSELSSGAAVDFTLYYPEEQRWEGQDYRINVDMT
jgi:glucoamylase